MLGERNCPFWLKLPGVMASHSHMVWLMISWSSSYFKTMLGPYPLVLNDQDALVDFAPGTMVFEMAQGIEWISLVICTLNCTISTCICALAAGVKTSLWNCQFLWLIFWFNVWIWALWKCEGWTRGAAIYTTMGWMFKQQAVCGKGKSLEGASPLFKT